MVELFSPDGTVLVELLPRIIGITGTPGHQKQIGKDTLGDFLVDKCGYTKMSFADPLKKMLATALDEDYELYEFEAIKNGIVPELGLTRRELLQTLGTEWGRAQHRDFWVQLARRRIEALPKDARLVFTDVRFNNEADLVHQMFGAVVQIKRGIVSKRGIVDRIKDAFTPWQVHSSERGIRQSKVDFVVHNSHPTPEEFAAHAVAYLQFRWYTRQIMERN